MLSALPEKAAVPLCEHCGQPVAAWADAAELVELSVVVPAFNEAGQIVDNLRLISEQAALAAPQYELVAVDDGSSDNTWQLLTDLANHLPLRALRLTRNFGKEAAISAGLAASHGRACLVIDADLQHPPDLIPQMVRLWREEGWEVVEGIKSSRGRERQVNRWGAWVFYTLLSRLSGYHFSGASDFKLLDRKVVAAWQQMQERNTFFRGMIRWMGFRRIEVPFDVPERLDSMSRWSFFGLVRLAMIALTAFSSLPLQVVTILGSFFLGCSFFFALYALALYFAGKALPGFTTIILLELIIGGVLMVSLGIIGTYVARIYDEAKHRPRYLVASRLESLSLRRHQGAK